MGQSQTTEIQVFKGLHIKPAPHLVSPSAARFLSNVSIRSGNLKPIRSPKYIEGAPMPYAYYFRNRMYYFPSWRSNVEWNGVWYWSDAFGQGKVLSDGTELPLGIAPPVAAPTLTAGVPGDGDGLTGNFNYLYTYFDPVTGSESPPSPPSSTIAMDKSAVTLSDFVPLEHYSIRIYRIGGIITAYSAVKTIDGASVDYLDDAKYAQIEGSVLTTLRAYPPPDGLHLLCEHKGRFWGASDSKLYFTPLGKPDAWYALDYISFDFKITGIASTANGLIVCTKFETRLIAGLNAQTFTNHVLSSSDGCESPLSMTGYKGNAVWSGTFGFMVSNGASIHNIAQDKIGKIVGLDIRGSVVYDDVYYASFGGIMTPNNELYPQDDLYPGSVSGSIRLKSGMFVIDFTFPEPEFSTIESDNIGYVGNFNSQLYQISNPSVGEANIITESGNLNLVTESGNFQVIADELATQSLSQMFAGDDLERIQYRSPLLTDGSMGILKSYEKLRFTFVGIILVTVKDDHGRIMATKQLISETRRAAKWLGIPVKSNKAYGLFIEIEGIAILDSIRYTWTPQETL